MQSQTRPLSMVRVVAGCAGILAALVVIWQAETSTASAQATGTGQDNPAVVSGDACPDGTVGQPPSCLAITGDTPAALTTVMTPATLAARGREPFSQVLGVMEMNPAAQPGQAPASVSVSSPSALSSQPIAASAASTSGSSPQPTANAPAVVAAAPQLPNTGAGGLLNRDQAAGPAGVWLSLLGMAILAIGLAGHRRWSRA
ncbi:MAG TPA: hypothetical protein VK821_06365 [Dehalococcoidia bacterium]|nr:hypothetical protein [Dehalococcoidia bacterium]